MAFVQFVAFLYFGRKISKSGLSQSDFDAIIPSALLKRCAQSFGDVAELVDAHDLGLCTFGCESSSLSVPTEQEANLQKVGFFV